MWEKKYLLSILFLVLLVANGLVYRTIFAPHMLTTTNLVVREGRAMLVRSPNGLIVLVGAGPDASILRALGNELPPWQRTIDLVLLTDATTASAGGLPAVMSRYQVKNLVRSGTRGSKSLEEALAAAASAETGLQQTTAVQNQRLMLGDGTYLDIIISPNGVADVYTSNGEAVTRIR